MQIKVPDEDLQKELAANQIALQCYGRGARNLLRLLHWVILEDLPPQGGVVRNDIKAFTEKWSNFPEVRTRALVLRDRIEAILVRERLTAERQ